MDHRQAKVWAVTFWVAGLFVLGFLHLWVVMDDNSLQGRERAAQGVTWMQGPSMADWQNLERMKTIRAAWGVFVVAGGIVIGGYAAAKEPPAARNECPRCFKSIDPTDAFCPHCRADLR